MIERLIDEKPGVAFYLVSSFVDFERGNAVNYSAGIQALTNTN